MANPNVFQSLIQPIRSVSEYGADLDQQDIVRAELQSRRRQNSLQDMATQQQVQRQNALQRAAAGWGASTTDEQRIQSLRANPMTFDAADALEKSIIERTKAKASAQKDTSDAGGKDVETENKVISVYRDMIGMAQSPEAAAELVRVMHSDPRLAKTAIARVPLEQGLAQINADPKAFAQWKQQFGLGASKFIEQNKPTLTTQNLGGTSRIVATPGLGGPPTVATEAPITQSADNRATVGASLANAAAVRDAAKLQADAARASANVQRDQATEMKLADDYRAQSKEFAASKSAHEQLKATLGSATTSPAATLAAATKFMKILDPGSVVRESELGMALAASGVIDRAMNYVSTLQSGQKLTATQADDFKKISEQMFQAAQRVQQEIDKDYQGKAKAYGLRPEMVTQDLGQNANITSWESLKK